MIITYSFREDGWAGWVLWIDDIRGCSVMRRVTKYYASPRNVPKKAEGVF